eukprot:Blabericola_migrator_1__1924@NODE_1523_length_4348_cov_17_645176_g557_i4_p1_GENE_NODE_1523_length_4348_cov_17_645176_g557_i4NODE_1523_length_4348_cov_17_645176_g557_i4_p1_ORF_typecomplete_len253_score33_26RT_RNaseH/PF17917_1/5_1e30RT_RNaseH_2/PF17919_1/3_9e22Peptidase_A17/PF05380_13/0_024Integrase_H2C2/PF17921_1/1e04Integrase_H2C2/PF17921_1/0_058DNA_pol_viral_C/PF00336_18/0_052_NODE_1523_length_4348_cov_17_645176_g557_i425393297
MKTITLAGPRGKGKFVLFTDASESGIGAVLCQEQDGELRVIEFASAKLTNAQRNWSTSEREGWAVVWALRRFDHIVCASHIVVFTDHSALQWLHNAIAGRLLRRGLELQRYDLDIRHLSGEKNATADYITRMRDDTEDIEVPDIFLPKPGVEILALEPARPVAAPYVPTVEEYQKEYENVPEEDRAQVQKGDDGLLYHIQHRTLYVPEALRECLLSWFHAAKYGGHAGVGRMFRRMRKSSGGGPCAKMFRRM